MAQDRSGQRGGSTESFAEGQRLFEIHKADEKRELEHLILEVADQKGEVHGDDLAHVQLSEPNLIGAVMQGLGKRGLLERLNRQGVEEHRRNRSRAARGSSVLMSGVVLKTAKTRCFADSV